MTAYPCRWPNRQQHQDVATSLCPVSPSKAKHANQAPALASPPRHSRPRRAPGASRFPLNASSLPPLPRVVLGPRPPGPMHRSVTVRSAHMTVIVSSRCTSMRSREKPHLPSSFRQEWILPIRLVRHRPHVDLRFIRRRRRRIRALTPEYSARLFRSDDPSAHDHSSSLPIDAAIPFYRAPIYCDCHEDRAMQAACAPGNTSRNKRRCTPVQAVACGSEPQQPNRTIKAEQYNGNIRTCRVTSCRRRRS